MSAPRNLGSIPASLFAGPGKKEWSYYVRVDFGSGTKRWTDRAGGDVRDVGDGHGSQTWDADRALIISALTQSMDDPLQVQSVKFGNLDNLWTAYALSTAGIRGVPIAIYAGWFDASLVFQGALEMFIGYLDAGDFSDGDLATISVRPFLRSYLKQTPSKLVSKTDFPLAVPPGTKVTWGSSTGVTKGQSHVTSASSSTGGGTTINPPPNPDPVRTDNKIIPVPAPTPATGLTR